MTQGKDFLPAISAINMQRLLIMLWMFLLVLCSAEDELEVRTRSGIVKGITVDGVEGKTVDAYLGIPYGASTGGKNRFSPPKEAEPWNGVFDASRFSSSCVQHVGERFRNAWWVSTNKESEDCLTLNIWVPKPRPRKSAVMVWIHGGGFTAGSSDIPLYNGAVLAAREEIIVVSLNYRLSVFGLLYLAHPLAPGNVALMDQALALKWVQDNIHSFGGNPERVTIFGESAGGAAVGLHLVIPSSLDLFKNAILQSGTATMVGATSGPDAALKSALSLAQVAGCPVEEDGREETIRCLQKLSTEKLLELFSSGDDLQAEMRFTPVVDGKYIIARPTEHLSEGRFCGEKNVMLGYTKEDGSFMIPIMLPHVLIAEQTAITQEEIKHMVSGLAQFYNRTSSLFLETVEFMYKEWESDVSLSLDGVLRLFTDVFFACSTSDTAEKIAAKGNNVFFYRFDHVPKADSSSDSRPSWLGSTHGDELPFVFGQTLKQTGKSCPVEVKFAKQIMRYWANFARNGDPNDEYLPFWSKYTTQEKLWVHLDSEGFSVSKSKGQRECFFWNNIFPKISQGY